jgi:protein-disulfide isomerase
MKRGAIIRSALVSLAATMTLPACAAGPSKDAFVQSVLHDPDAPLAGNPNGDVTIVAFLDYNCPFCRRSTPELDRFIASDPGVRVVYKDWPILAASSVLEAKVALASKYQGRYAEAHDALMAIKLRPATPEAVKAAVQASGIDVDRLNKDLAAHDADITALLQRTLSQADAMHLQGTPVFLIGPYIKAQELDFAGFRQSVADARAKQRGGSPVGGEPSIPAKGK